MSSELEYKERQTDPYQRILNLKSELIKTKEQIDEHAEKFKDNVYITETDNITKILEELDLYKTKIDAFINYDVFNKIDSETDENSADSSKEKSEFLKKDFYSNFEKYNRITENLLSQIKQTEHDMIHKNTQDLNIKYEIFSNPEFQMENLQNRISELEELMSNLEKTIGNWNLVNNLLNLV